MRNENRKSNSYGDRSFPGIKSSAILKSGGKSNSGDDVIFRVRVHSGPDGYYITVVPGLSDSVMPKIGSVRLDADKPPTLSVGKGDIVYMRCDLVSTERQIYVGSAVPQNNWDNKVIYFFLAEIAENADGDLYAKKDQGFLSETTISFVYFDNEGEPRLAMIPVAGGRVSEYNDPLDDL